MLLYSWCVLSLFLLVTNFATNPKQADSDSDCGLFLFRTEYHLYPMRYYYAFEIRDECPNDNYLIFERKNSFTKEIRISKFSLEDDQFQDFKKLVEHIDKTEFNSIENLQLNDGLRIDYSYIDATSDLTRHKITWPPASKEDANKVKQELLIFKKLFEFTKQKCCKYEINRFKKELKSYGMK